MTKATGAWDSLIKGVSEQVAHQRFPGQHWEQLNMVSDPVRGLSRRRGSMMQSELALASSVIASDATIADTRAFGEQSLYLGAVEYSFMFRTEPRPSGSTMSGLAVLNKTTGKLVPVQVAASDTFVLNYLIGGVNSITSVGSLVLLAPKGVNTTLTQVDQVATGAHAGETVAWVKGGSYSRTYTLSIKQSNGVVKTAQYTTPASYYQGILDTSDIPATNPDGTANKDYQKLVNDRVYAYQKAVNQWIGTAAAAIQPAAIATSLRNAINAVIDTSVTTTAQVNSTIVFAGATSISVDDGGDGSQFVGVAQVVKQVSDLSTIHSPGKVVKIQPQSGSSKVYYVKAVAKNTGETGWVQVTWEETAGILLTPSFVTMLGVMKDNIFYVASSPSLLASLAGITVPPWAPSSSGDTESQSLPAFLGRDITYLRMFQDRLIIVAGSTVFMSRSGDYFNFFKQSALTVQENDPIEIYALGSEDDVVTAGTLLDRNLILFGKQWQYAVPGRDAITPTSAFVAVQSGYRDSNDCPPETSGNLIFFTQQRQGKLTVQQMQTGAYADTLTASEITQQLNKYLNGNPQQIVAVTSPSAVFLRTDTLDNGFWVYSYLDSAGNTERLFDSWSKWTFDASLGNIVGMCAKDGDLLVTTLRKTVGPCYLVTDKFTLSTDVPDCHLDSQRPLLTPGTMGPIAPLATAIRGVYTKAAGMYWLLGDVQGTRLTALRAQVGAAQDANMVLGAPFESSVVLTNPYMRDQDGKAILDGRLTLGNLNVTLFESSAMSASAMDLVNADTSASATLEWIARSANAWVLNTQQLVDTTTVVVGVYKEIRDVKVQLKSRSWLPLTISAIEWTGQFFTRRRG